MIHFIRPYWLLLLFPALLYLVWVIYQYRQYNPWKKVCDPHLLHALVLERPVTTRRWFYLPLFILYLIAVFALAGPAWNKAQLPVYRDISSMVLVLDLSKNMLADDLKPDRLSRAKYKIRDLIAAAQNMQLGLVAFTSEPFVASPLSNDANTLNGLLDELYPQMMPVSGSNIGEGLIQGRDLLKQAGAEHGEILLITASEPTTDAYTAANELAKSGSRLDVLAMLDNNAANQSTITHLRDLADEGNGKFIHFSTDSSDIQSILKNMNMKQAVKDENIENAYLWKDAGPWFCLLLIPFALVVLREKVRHEKN